LFLLLCRSTQAFEPPPQSVKPDAEQRTAQVPSLQIGSPPMQAVPHAPQFRLSEDVSTQFPTPPFLPAHCV
jgi:hypothetical protein